MFTPRKRIYASLNGGLGNQMFQYAAARSLALRLSAELILDTWSGFVRDFQYRRNYELGELPIDARAASPRERLPIWIFRWMHRGDRVRYAAHESLWYGEFLVEKLSRDPALTDGAERQFAYHPQFHGFTPRRSAWLVGYWQSPLYFTEIAASLRVELMPPPPAQDRFRVLGGELQRTESVALGVRLYEESTKPGVHAYGGHLKGVTEIRGAIARLHSRCPTARFYVFCTHRAPLLTQLGLPADAVFVTPDEGYTGTLETLWLLTRCRHHLFTNSSYYWWGAWLSAAVRGGEEQQIIAADNFINRDGLCENWERF